MVCSSVGQTDECGSGDAENFTSPYLAHRNTAAYKYNVSTVGICCVGYVITTGYLILVQIIISC